MQCFKGGNKILFGARRASSSTLLSGWEEESAPGRGVFLDFDVSPLPFLGLSGGMVLTSTVYLAHLHRCLHFCSISNATQTKP